MNKKDYIKIAEAIKNRELKYPEATIANQFIHSLCDVFKLDNPNFKRDTFINFINK